MHCIRCGNEMEKRRERKILIDHCRTCDTVWLDGGELEALEEGREHTAEELAGQERAEAARDRARTVASLDLCPTCQRQLVTTSILGVEIERCRHCGGIFFDQGELQTILRLGRAGRLTTLKRRLRRASRPPSRGQS